MSRKLTIKIPFLKDPDDTPIVSDDDRPTREQAGELSLALREARDSLTLTANGVYEWYRQGDVPWSFTALGGREGLIDSAGLVWAGIFNDCHTRVLPRPYPAHEYAMKHAQAFPHPAKPEIADRNSRNAQAYIRSTTLADTETYVGVKVADRAAVDRMLSRTKGRGKALDKELSKFGDDLDELRQKISGAGVLGEPVDQDTLDWLIHRSIGLGLPDPLNIASGGIVGLEDLGVYYDDLDHIWHPGKQYVEVVGGPSRNGSETRRYVSIVSIGRTHDIDIPRKYGPWVPHAEALEFPVEWSIRHRTLTAEEASTRVGHQLDIIDDQVGQYRKHGLRRPPEVDRVGTEAIALRDQMEHAHELDAMHVDVWARAAVVGATPEEAIHNARALKQHYRKLRFDVHQKIGQRGLYREFWPGEGLSTVSHRRTMPVKYFASAMPNIATGVGHKDGFLLGHSATVARRTFTWNLFFGMEEQDKSGFVPAIAEPGAGKSTLGIALGYLATVADVDTTILDLSGPMAELCYMQDIRDVSRHIDLSSAEPGQLSPYYIIGDPRLDQFYDHPAVRTARREGASQHVLDMMASKKHNDAINTTRFLRQQQAESILTRFLPASYREDSAVIDAIKTAARRVPGESTSTLDEVVELMPRAQGVRGKIRRQWDDMMNFPQTALFFGQLAEEDRARPKLLVITGGGINLPDEKKPESSWSEEERLSVPLMTSAAYLASRRVYDKPMRERHLFIGDEVHKFRRFGAGRTFWDHLARDSRKWNTKAVAFTQKPQEMKELELEGLIDEMLAGRIETPAVANEALDLMGVPTGYGFDRTLATLSERRAGRRLPYREFIVKIGGRVELVRIDLRYLPQLAAVIDGGAAGNREGVASLSLVKDEEAAA